MDWLMRRDSLEQLGCVMCSMMCSIISRLRSGELNHVKVHVTGPAEIIRGFRNARCPLSIRFLTT
jgi:hypothetical protein